MDGGAERGIESGVGALLRASRMRRGEDLQAVAEALCIRLPYMVAIEEGRYDDLPGMAYGVGFVRGYADHLGLDPAEIVRRFKAEAEGLSERKDLVFPSPVAEGGIPGGAVLFVAVLLVGIAYGAWYVGSSRDGFLSDLVSPLPDRIAALVSGVTGSESEPTADVQTVEAGPQVPDLVPTMADAPSVTVEDSAETLAAEAPVADFETAAPQPEESPVAADAPKVPAVVVEAQPVETAAPPAESVVAVVETPAPRAEPEPQPVAKAPVVEPAPVAQPEPPAVAASAPAPQIEPNPVVETPAVVPPSPAPKEAAKAAEAAADARAAAEETDVAAQPAPTAAAAGEQVAAVPDAPNAALAAPAATVPAGDPRIVVHAKYDSWIQIRDGVHRRLLVTRLLRAGDTYQVPDMPGLTLLTGNAGALEISVDGESIDPIGPMGAVRRNVALDAERLLAGTAAHD